MTELTPGLKGQANTLVTPDKTANRIASGVVEVYATPQMIGLMEKAASESVQPFLPPGYSTVGTLVEVRHLAATPPGLNVRAESRLLEVEGRRLVFAVVAYDDQEKIGEGRHERFIIEDDRFLKRVNAKYQDAGKNIG